MARSTAAAGVAGPGYFGHRRQPVCLNLSLYRAFRDEKAGADERFVAGPIISSGVAVFANGGKQCIAGESRTVFVVRPDTDLY